MAMKTAQAKNGVARKGLAVVLAALLCMPMTGFEYIALADEGASAASIEADSGSSADGQTADADSSASAQGDADAVSDAADVPDSSHSDEAVPAQQDSQSSAMADAPLANAPKADLGTPADVRLVVSDAPTTGAGEGAMYIVRTGEKPPTVALPVDMKIKEGESIGSYSDPVTLTVKVPYLYYDEQGMVVETADKKEWIEHDGQVGACALPPCRRSTSSGISISSMTRRTSLSKSTSRAMS